MKRATVVQMIVCFIAIVFMILPMGAVCRFISSEAGTQYEVLKTFSFFNLSPFVTSIIESVKQLETPDALSIIRLIPFWFLNLAPFMCAIAVVLLTVVVLISQFANRQTKSLQIASVVLSAAALVLSLIPLVFYGLKFYNATTMMVSFMMLCSIVLGVQRLTSGKLYTASDEDEEIGDDVELVR